MKKNTLFILFLAFLLLFVISCKKKEKVKVVPQKQETKQEVQLEEEKVPVIKKETLTEEELFERASIEELNKKYILKRIFFDFDKANIRPDMEPVLSANAEWLKKHPSVIILIEGHCDERGTVEYNLALGERRAKAARDYLISLGIDPSRIKIVSYGKSKPLDPGHNESAWAKNRRCEFRIISK